MRISRSISFCAIVLVLTAMPLLAQEVRRVPPRITQDIDETQLVPLTGNTHPLARAEYDQGVAPPDLPMERMLLLLRRSPEQEASLQQLLEEQQDPGSVHYHQWLTPEQFGDRFGPALEDTEKITGWLKSQGFRVDGVANGRNVVEFSGTAAQVERALHTQIHSYLVNGEQHWANAQDPQIPAALSPVVAGIVSLDNFPMKTMHHRAGAFRKAPGDGAWAPASPAPEFTYPNGGTSYWVGPYDFATIYNVLPLWNAGIDGTGQSVAIAGRSNIALQDVRNFRSVFGLPAHDPTIILNGPDPGTANVDSEFENVLDVEWAGAVAKGATINLVVSKTTTATNGAGLSAQYIVNNNLAPVLSSSYGNCELFMTVTGQDQFYNNLWQQAAAQGITVVVAAGDNGSGFCDANENAAVFGLAVNGFASTPYNVAVGGTDFSDTFSQNQSSYWSSSNNPVTLASAKSYVPEMTWNDSCASPEEVSWKGYPSAEALCNSGIPQLNFLLNVEGGSGGASSLYSKPSWQSGVNGIPSDGQRDVPDVSLFAGTNFWQHAYVVCQADNKGPCNPSSPGGLVVTGGGGDSFGAPAFAGIMALINQKTGSRQGLANPTLYNLASVEYGSSSSPNTANRQACNASTPPASGNTCVFYDVTAGNNDVPCQKGSPNCYVSNASDKYGLLSTSSNSLVPAYAAGPGYDLATGLGSVNVANLVNKWPSNTQNTTTTVTANPSSITASGTTQVTAVVQAAGSSAVPSGSVVFNASATSSGANSFPLGSATLTNSGGNATATLTVRGSQFPSAGNYTITATYSGDANFNGFSGTVSIIVTTPQTLTLVVSPSSLAFTAVEGGTSPAPQNLAVSSTPSAVYNWTAQATTSSGGNWLSIDKTSGGGDAAINVFVSTTEMKAGTYQGAVTVTAPGLTGSPQTIPVAFTVSTVVTSGPVITAVKNGASYAANAVSPGEIVAIFGTGLGPAQLTTLTLTSDGLVSNQLAGTTVQFNGIAAPIIYTWATAVAAIVPYEVSGNNVQVVVTYQGETSAPLSLPVVGSVPGIFTANASGSGQAAASNQDGTLNSAAQPAPVGSVVILFATGEGQTLPGGIDGKPASAPLPHPILPVSVTIGGVAATVAYAGGAPGEVAGLMQLNVYVPAGVSGPAVPVVLHVGDAQSQAATTISVPTVVPPPPVFIVTNQLTTGAVATDSGGNPICAVTPSAKSSFLATDPYVYVWLSFNGIQTGDVLAYNWIHPSGAVDASAWTSNISGSGCAASSFAIAGQQPAKEPGNWQVRVSRNGFQLFVLPFTIIGVTTPPPTLTSLNPSSVPALSPAVGLTVIGTGFTSSSVVRWSSNGQTTSLITTFESSTSLTAQIPANLLTTPGTAQITVVNGTGNPSNALTFTITTSIVGLTITSLSPSSIYGGAGSFRLLVNGTGFARGAIVLWNNSSLITTVLSSTQLLASVDSGLTYSLGTVSIKVSSGGQTSAATSLPVNVIPTAQLANQRVTTFDVGYFCPVSPPPAVSTFSTRDVVFLYFIGTVTNNDLLTDEWVGPDGTVIPGVQWNVAAGGFCDTDLLNLSGLLPSQLGAWDARVYDNGTMLFSVPFTVGQF